MINFWILISSLFAMTAYAQIEYPSDARYYNPSTRKALADKSIKKTEMVSHTDSCKSHENFKTVFEFLIADKNYEMAESKALEIAMKVSEGCNGAADRFIKIYQTLKKSGVALNKALEVAFEFSAMDDERTQNFIIVFQKTFLENYYDFDFPTAYKVSFELSRDANGKIHQIRDDFMRTVEFCVNNKNMGLPLRTCALISIEISKLSTLYPSGISSDFESCYSYLRNQKKLGLSQVDALKIIPRILENGPGSFVNFKDSFEYVTKGDKVHLNTQQALKLGMKLAKQTMVHDEESNGK